MEDYECLLCGHIMKKEHKISYIDYHCGEGKDHHFACRIGKVSPLSFNLQMLKLRVKLMTGKENLYLKLNYDQGFSEVWSKNRRTERVQINSIIYPDFTDLEKLKKKLRTILLFS